ncbi:hypothetical protein HN446_05355 [bacterium]|nr:hypothetical protein [bacterium]
MFKVFTKLLIFTSLFSFVLVRPSDGSGMDFLGALDPRVVEKVYRGGVSTLGVGIDGTSCLPEASALYGVLLAKGCQLLEVPEVPVVKKTFADGVLSSTAEGYVFFNERLLKSLPFSLKRVLAFEQAALIATRMRAEEMVKKPHADPRLLTRESISREAMLAALGALGCYDCVDHTSCVTQLRSDLFPVSGVSVAEMKAVSDEFKKEGSLCGYCGEMRDLPRRMASEETFAKTMRVLHIAATLGVFAGGYFGLGNIPWLGAKLSVPVKIGISAAAGLGAGVPLYLAVGRADQRRVKLIVRFQNPEEVENDIVDGKISA